MRNRSHRRGQDSAAQFSASDALDVARVCSVGGLLGESVAMQALFERIARAASTQASVLIVGESGSGKELTARCLHELSARADQPFLVFNCGALPPSLIEPELFGREAGGSPDSTLTHFVSQQGYLERAGEGTLLLEEVPELAPDVQLKLLRVLESGRMTRVGASQEWEVRCRVMATMQRDAHASRLRPELLDRLSICTIAVPPLREREEDAALLAHYFLAVLNAEEGTSKKFSGASLHCLRQHPWPGNVRELRNAVHRAFILADGDLDLAAALDKPLTLSSNGDGQVLRIPVGTPL
ncbi:MAG TPA: sigma 54-interacting transcriptional regulator, partial [Povalibacter sp.]|nr:sigma 54-interacting transcriptional regulator [Povalibacter sp.]